MKTFVIQQKSDKTLACAALAFFALPVTLFCYFLIAGVPESAGSSVYTAGISVENLTSPPCLLLCGCCLLIVIAAILARKCFLITAISIFVTGIATIILPLISHSGEFITAYGVIGGAVCLVAAAFLLMALDKLKSTKLLVISSVVCGTAFVGYALIDLLLHAFAWISEVANLIGEHMGTNDIVEQATTISDILSGKLPIDISFHTETLLLISLIPLAMLCFAFALLGSAPENAAELEHIRVSAEACHLPPDLLTTTKTALYCVFSVLSASLFIPVWHTKLSKKVRLLKNAPLAGVSWQTVAYVLVPFYNCVWVKRSAKIISARASELGIPISDFSGLYIALSLFKMDLIVFAMLQENFNTIAKASLEAAESALSSRKEDAIGV